MAVEVPLGISCLRRDKKEEEKQEPLKAQQSKMCPLPPMVIKGP